MLSTALGFSYHDNNVKFLLRAPQVVGYAANYLVQSHFITSGQDPDSQCYLRRRNGGYHIFNPETTFTYSIGRKGSSDVAGWWIANAGQSTFGHSPGSLNFALGGTLSFSLAINGAPSPDAFTLKSIYIGQGSGLRRNKQQLVGAGWYFTFKRGGNDVNLVELLNVSRK
ncbi:hypothetical protein CYLTODRAFT_459380 [Cylindrobasidium torrendii FP15055 ss-10]|uniref:Uncharacterized protein n=1 Tax=Cylindrobasidium torrendii FP15055 ss-10 TaxID=1314674 RepID=A0A0D7AUV9_9AGAR|nr:hypothetical protein CYLTODRAFT_459380 [Cylindrobasidium torrendii FP15055 ss-10]